MAMIQPSFTSSKWNMGEIFGLKFHLSYLHTPQRFFLKSLHAQRMSFLLLLISPTFHFDWVTDGRVSGLQSVNTSAFLIV